VVSPKRTIAPPGAAATALLDVLAAELIGRGGAPGAGDLLADHGLGVIFRAQGLGVAALAGIDRHRHVDHHLALGGVAVDLVEQQALGALVVAAEELQAHLALVGHLRARGGVEVVHDERRGRQQECEVGRAA
jgi:hypothetical protein